MLKSGFVFLWREKRKRNGSTFYVSKWSYIWMSNLKKKKKKITRGIQFQVKGDIIERVAILYCFKLLWCHPDWLSAGTTEQILIFSAPVTFSGHTFGLRKSSVWGKISNPSFSTDRNPSTSQTVILSFIYIFFFTTEKSLISTQAI